MTEQQPSTAPEAAVDPDRRIVDAHHHLWERKRQRYLVDELEADTASHNVTHTVFIDCSSNYRTDGPDHLKPIGETEFVAGQARLSEKCKSRISAIVSAADLTLGDAVEEVLHAHEAAGEGLFRGVRHRAAWDPGMSVNPGKQSDVSVLDLPEFRRGVNRLGALGHSLDFWQYHSNLPAVAGVAEAAEQTTVIVDHLGGPVGLDPYVDRAAMREQWHAGMRRLAACPNVVVKLGGIGMQTLSGEDWDAATNPVGSDVVVARWGDDIRWCIDTFGPERCMFESNFPVDGAALSYAVLWNAFQKIAADYTPAEQDLLFVGTATRAYRIS